LYLGGLPDPPTQTASPTDFYSSAAPRLPAASISDRAKV
jgi:hypothetical protein